MSLIAPTAEAGTSLRTSFGRRLVYAGALAVVLAGGFLAGRLLGVGLRPTRTTPLPAPGRATLSVSRPTISSPLGSAAAIPDLRLPKRKPKATRIVPATPAYVAPPPTAATRPPAPKVATCAPC